MWLFASETIVRTKQTCQRNKERWFVRQKSRFNHLNPNTKTLHIAFEMSDAKVRHTHKPTASNGNNYTSCGTHNQFTIINCDRIIFLARSFEPSSVSINHITRQLTDIRLLPKCSPIYINEWKLNVLNEFKAALTKNAQCTEMTSSVSVVFNCIYFLFHFFSCVDAFTHDQNL